MRLKEVIIYLLSVAGNIILSLILNAILFGNNLEMLIFVVCGVILLSALVISIIARKMNYKLDIFAYDIKDQKYLVLNSIFVGCLFTVPIVLIISLFL